MGSPKHSESGPAAEDTTPVTPVTTETTKTTVTEETTTVEPVDGNGEAKD